jgi:hypothetical protein
MPQSQISPLTNSGKHLYKRGWLGFIPVIGVFIGFGLLLMGIFKYKNRKLALIGIACMGLTALFYGTGYLFYYYTFYTNSGRNGFTDLAVMEMNSLVKTVEFYKIQHHSYPDSIEQLRLADNSVVIYDPISVASSVKFYYQKIDSGYTLFSCGLDKVPNTDDDVYPDLNIQKTGFIRATK